jgi:hypothetical protein
MKVTKAGDAEKIEAKVEEIMFDFDEVDITFAN